MRFIDKPFSCFVLALFISFFLAIILFDWSQEKKGNPFTIKCTIRQACIVGVDNLVNGFVDRVTDRLTDKIADRIARDILSRQESRPCPIFEAIASPTLVVATDTTMIVKPSETRTAKVVKKTRRKKAR